MSSPQGKPESSLRQSMAWLHTWAGLVPGWLLFLVFLFGTAAFFQQEISAWMRPELRGAQVSPQALDKVGYRLAADGQGAESWYIAFPHARGGDTLNVAWRPSMLAARQEHGSG